MMSGIWPSGSPAIRARLTLPGEGTRLARQRSTTCRMAHCASRDGPARLQPGAEGPIAVAAQPPPGPALQALVRRTAWSPRLQRELNPPRAPGHCACGEAADDSGSCARCREAGAALAASVARRPRTPSPWAIQRGSAKPKRQPLAQGSRRGRRARGRLRRLHVAHRAGDIAHRRIQSAFSGLAELRTRVTPSPTDANGRLDLAYRVSGGWQIGEIKPANRQGIRDGMNDLLWYERQIEAADRTGDTAVTRMDEVIEPASSMGSLTPFDYFPSPSGLCIQNLYVNRPKAGLYTYFCRPSRSELAGVPCCKDPEQPEAKKQEQLQIKTLAYEQELGDLKPLLKSMIRRLGQAPPGTELVILVPEPTWNALDQRYRNRMQRLLGGDLRTRPLFGYRSLGWTMVTFTAASLALPMAVGTAGAMGAGATATATASGTTAAGPSATVAASASTTTGGVIIPIAATSKAGSHGCRGREVGSGRRDLPEGGTCGGCERRRRRGRATADGHPEAEQHPRSGREARRDAGQVHQRHAALPLPRARLRVQLAAERVELRSRSRACRASPSPVSG